MECVGIAVRHELVFFVLPVVLMSGFRGVIMNSDRVIPHRCGSFSLLTFFFLMSSQRPHFFRFDLRTLGEKR